jgi:hypothetical protein
MKHPQPRVGGHPTHYGDTWIEPEEWCYLHGGMTRRARVRFPNGRLRVVRCGIPDTWFSIPVRKSDGDGYITINTDNNELEFRPHTPVVPT